MIPTGNQQHNFMIVSLIIVMFCFRLDTDYLQYLNPCVSCIQRDASVLYPCDRIKSRFQTWFQALYQALFWAKLPNEDNMAASQVKLHAKVKVAGLQTQLQAMLPVDASLVASQTLLQAKLPAKVEVTTFQIKLTTNSD